MWALIKGLSTGAATWRKDQWAPEVEFAALSLERMDAWGYALFAAIRRVERIPVPGRIQILRPGEEPEPTRAVTDPREVAAWFARRFKTKQ